MPLSWLLFGILAWFLLGAVLSAKARRGMGSGVIDYFLANRTVGGFVSAMSYSATTYSAFMMVGLVGLTYKGGVASLGFELTYLVGTVFLLVLFAPRYWLAGRRYGLMTPSELLATRYGSKWVGATASLLCLVTLVPYASVQLMGMGYLLEGVSGGAFPFWAGMAVAAVITVVFSIWAGLRSVALTDALQASIMLVVSCLLVAFIVVFLFPGGWGNAVATRPDLLKVSWPFPMFLGLTLPWTFFALTNPQVVQRLYAPKDIRSIRGMVAGFSAFGFIYTVLCVVLGLSAALLVPGLKNPDGAMAALLTKVPRALALLVVLSIFAAAVSTLNSIILTLSSMFGRDLLRAVFSPFRGKGTVLGEAPDTGPDSRLFCFRRAEARADRRVVFHGLGGTDGPASRDPWGLFLEARHGSRGYRRDGCGRRSHRGALPYESQFPGAMASPLGPGCKRLCFCPREPHHPAGSCRGSFHRNRGGGRAGNVLACPESLSKKRGPPQRAEGPFLLIGEAYSRARPSCRTPSAFPNSIR